MGSCCLCSHSGPSSLFYSPTPPPAILHGVLRVVRGRYEPAHLQGPHSGLLLHRWLSVWTSSSASLCSCTIFRSSWVLAGQAHPSLTPNSSALTLCSPMPTDPTVKPVP